MAKRKGNTQEFGDHEVEQVPAHNEEAQAGADGFKGFTDAPTDPAPQAPASEFINLIDHPEYEVLPKVPRLVLYRGDTYDLMRLRPSQFQRLTTNADAANIVRKR